MENVLDTYALPYDPKCPQVCIDEKPYQLLSDVFESLSPKPGKAKKVDYEYKREGPCNFFIVFEPLTQTRKIKVTKRRTAVDFAYFMKEVAAAAAGCRPRSATWWWYAVARLRST